MTDSVTIGSLAVLALTLTADSARRGILGEIDWSSFFSQLRLIEQTVLPNSRPGAIVLTVAGL